MSVTNLLSLLILDLRVSIEYGEAFYKACYELFNDINSAKCKEQEKVLKILYRLLNVIKQTLKGDIDYEIWIDEILGKVNIEAVKNAKINHTELLKILNAYLKQFNLHLTTLKDIRKLKDITYIEPGRYKSFWKIISTSNIDKYLLSVEHTTKTLFDNKIIERREIKVAKNTVVKLLVTSKDFELDKKLNAFDLIVYDACLTFYAQGLLTFTDKEIFELLYNRKAKDEIGLLKINESIHKLRKTFVRLDYSAETKIRNFPTELAFGYLETYLLPVEKEQRKEVAIYRFIAKPKLFEYARAKHQIETVPIEVLNVDLNLSQSTLLLRDFLLRRIADMKGANKQKKKLPNRISLQTIYETFDAKDKTTRMRLRKKIQKILEHFKNTEYIKGYEISNKDIRINLTIQKSSIHAG